jgi:hypothetical protein
MTQEAVKKLKVWAITVVTIAGGITGIYEAFILIKKSMNETGKKIIQEHTIPVVKAEIKATVDSIFKHRTKSKSVGIRYVPEEDKLIYIHTNGKTYRPFLDVQEDAYYFINDDDEPEWCK